MKKKQQRRLTAIISLVVLVAALAGIIISGQVNLKSGTAKDQIVTVGVADTNDNRIWDLVNKELAPDHIQVKLRVFSDGQALNQATNSGQVNINAFQHYAFLKQQVDQLHFKLTAIGQTYIQPLNIYSKHVSNVKQLKSGAKIAIPNNPTNAGRALKVLEKAGLIKTDPKKGYLPTPNDITSNPKHLKIVEVDPAAVLKLLPNFAAGITNANYLQANHLNPAKEAIYQIAPNIADPYNKPWINILVTRTADKDNPTFKKVIAAYNSKAVYNLIKQKYNGVDLPAFKY